MPTVGSQKLFSKTKRHAVHGLVFTLKPGGWMTPHIFSKQYLKRYKNRLLKTMFSSDHQEKIVIVNEL